MIIPTGSFLTIHAPDYWGGGVAVVLVREKRYYEQIITTEEIAHAQDTDKLLGAAIRILIDQSGGM